MLVASSGLLLNDTISPTIINSPITSSYTEHGEITITQDSDFNVTYGFPGNGTKESPYRIEGLNITSDDKCISISYTDCYFEIVDCILSSAGGISGVFPPPETGIYLNYVDNANISLCNFSRFGYSLIIRYSSNITVDECASDSSDYRALTIYESHNVNVTDSEIICKTNHGVLIEDSENVNIIGCEVTSPYYPFRISDSTYVNLTNTVIDKRGLTLWGESIEQYITHTFTGTTIGGKPVGYFVNQSDIEVDLDSYGIVILANCNDSVVYGSEYSGTSTLVVFGFCKSCVLENIVVTSGRGNAIAISKSRNCIVQNCSLAHFLNNGILAQYSSCLEVRNSHFESMTFAVDLTTCQDCIIDNNTMTSISCGIAIGENSNDTIVSNNRISNMGDGVEVSNSKNISIVSNVIRDASTRGLDIISGENNTITDNLFLECDHGVYLQDDAINNTVFSNQFALSNDNHSYDEGIDNWWDNGIVGNAWDDYDDGGYYNISGPSMSVDHYPSLLILDSDKPVISGPEDFYTETGDFYITWNVSDEWPENY
jgi:parallel beta-helix repeat protein